MGISDWLAIGLTGLGLVMGTLGKRYVRRAGVILIALAVIGGAILHDRPTDAQQTNVTGDNNIVVPGNNNVVTVKRQAECPPDSNLIVYGAQFRNNGTGIKAGANTRMCIIDSEFQGNQKAIDQQ